MAEMGGSTHRDRQVTPRQCRTLAESGLCVTHSPLDLCRRARPAEEDVGTKDVVRPIAQALVDKPEEVEVREVEGEKTTVLELKVAEADLGKVIGRQGRTARAMRTIINAAATKLKKRAVLEILE